MQFDIFGTCVTRDAFTFENNKHTVNYYSSRSSLISAIQQPLNIDISKVNLNSRFFDRVVKDDLNKDFKRYSRKPKAKAIVIDLIQERHPLNILDGIGFTTYSEQYVKTKLPVGRLYKDDQKLRIFEKNISKIAKLFSQYELVILHEVSIGDTYITKNNEIEKLQLRDVDKYFIKKGYAYYDLFKKHIPNLKIIKIEGYLVDEKNKWGAGPSHFEEDYYIKFNEGLDYVINKGEDFYYKK